MNWAFDPELGLEFGSRIKKKFGKVAGIYWSIKYGGQALSRCPRLTIQNIWSGKKIICMRPTMGSTVRRYMT